jgi:hypothetical protein
MKTLLREIRKFRHSKSSIHKFQHPVKKGTEKYNPYPEDSSVEADTMTEI